MNYMIAYSDKNGNDFAQNFPWLLDDFSSVEDAKRNAVDLARRGYKNVTVFEYKEEQEYFSWDFVRQNIVAAGF